MRVDCIGKNKIKILLSEEEVLRLFGGYDMIDYSSPRSKATLNAILTSALPDEMLPLDCNQVLIEIRAESNGCAIYFTKVYKNGKKGEQKRLKSQNLAFTFSNSEDLICFICRTLPKDIISSEIFSITKKYILILTLGDTSPIDMYYLKEFCKEIITDEFAIAHIREYGKFICQNADSAIRKAFKTL